MNTQITDIDSYILQWLTTKKILDLRLISCYYNKLILNYNLIIKIKNAHHIQNLAHCSNICFNIDMKDAGSITTYDNVIAIKTSSLIKQMYVRIEKFTNLTALSLSRYNIISRQSLHNLTKISSLTIYTNQYITVNSISHLTNLTKLHISYSVTDMSDDNLSYLTKLFNLYVNNNNNITGTCFKNLTNITKLKIYHCSNITSFSELIFLTNLTLLTLYPNPYLTDEKLRYLTNIRSLDIDQKTKNYNITYHGISNMTNLKNISCRKTLIKAPDIQKMTNIIYFNDSFF